MQASDNAYSAGLAADDYPVDPGCRARLPYPWHGVPLTECVINHLGLLLTVSVDAGQVDRAE